MPLGYQVFPPARMVYYRFLALNPNINVGREVLLQLCDLQLGCASSGIL